ncbi:alpha/beta hydrolase [Salipaludibacillus neizhouensis]|uniref:Alpha/beta hydrolase n=2 Tax=Salipaludibacillus neizhouensis TaxID=885475 RepID=A0A3A9K742_9BACI|nr:alpha/beta hydrolase [Salipaludibacillus neizhouensis]RKL68824.1 alpha/beta hydrolase [Salipaludibacillus neizhouensis]
MSMSRWITKNKLKRISLWMKSRIQRTFEYDTYFWRMTTIGVWISVIVSGILAGLGNPTGIGTLIDLIIYFIINNFVFMIAAVVLATLLSFMYVPVPRLLLGSLVYAGGLVYFILDAQSLSPLFSVVIGFSFPVVGMILGIVVAVYTRSTWKLEKKFIVSLIPISVLFIVTAFIVSGDKSEIQRSFSENDPFEPLQLENPGLMGENEFSFFTFGSGTDKRRSEYGEEVGIVSKSVDASEYITKWSGRKESFWGFDETALPLNGRVWMPEGEKEFPLVLMVHGNHRMEHFSDEGYQYLGELLASRGFIAVSVDQNFLNYSGWSGIPNDDMKMRAWVLMQHLQQIQDYEKEEDNPFYNRINFDQVAIVGHSRGGQAAAMVADYKKWFEEDTTLSGMEDIHIESVVGIAPTDKTVDDERARLEEVNYLLLQGSRDGDVNTFQGDRQYLRSYFYEVSNRFKASVYIAEANHSQFNTDWGRMDMRLPGGIFLNRQQMMNEEAQQEVAKVYISAFLETTLLGQEEYRDLFRDVRYGQDWLPNNQYITRFEDGNYVTFTDFNQSQEEIHYMDGVEVEQEGFHSWDIDRAEDRRDVNKGVNGVEMAWKEEAQFTIELEEDFLAESFSENLDSFQLSLTSLDMEREAREETETPVIEIEMTSDNGEASLVTADPFRPVNFPIETQYTILPWFDDIMRDEKYEESEAPVFQTYEFPMEEFQENNRAFQSENITEITVYISNGPGKIMIDNFGFLMNEQ